MVINLVMFFYETLHRVLAVLFDILAHLPSAKQSAPCRRENADTTLTSSPRNSATIPGRRRSKPEPPTKVISSSRDRHPKGCTQSKRPEWLRPRATQQTTIPASALRVSFP